MIERSDRTELGWGLQVTSVLAGSDFSFGRLLEKLPAGAYACDTEGLITYFNQYAVQLWGRAPQLFDPIDRFCGSFKLFLPDGSPLAHNQCWMALALQMGKAYNGEEIIIERPDGQRLTALAHANPIFDAGGHLLGAVNVLVDITERKQVEELRHSLAAIIESSDDAIIGKTLDGIITSWNRGAERLYGYTAAEIIGKPISLLIPPDLRNELPDILERLKRGEPLDHYETQRLRRDGACLDISLTISPIRDALGQIIGASAIARDVTERKRSEQALKESEERLRLALDAGGMGTWEVDLRTGEGQIDANQAAILGLPPATPRLGMRDFLNLVHPDDRQEVRRQQAITLQGSDFRAEFRILRPNRQVRWLVVQGNTSRDATGRPYRVIGITYDITARKQAEDARRTLNAVLEQRVAERTADLNQAHAALRHEMAERHRMQESLFQQEKLAALGTLLANVAHELNNPLAVAAMQLDNLQEEGVFDSWSENLEILRQAVDRCKSVVQSFLALARQQTPTRGAVALDAVIHDVLVLHRHALEADSITLHLDLADDLPMLWADPHQLHHVVTNLITNSHHALQQTSPPRHLTLSAAVNADESHVTLKLVDTGAGIPADLQRRIFEPFFTTKSQGLGSGLGLPLCRNVVEGHGGSISLESQPGHGTTFCVTLPVANLSEPALEAAPEPAESAQNQRVAILLIDDEPGLAKVFTRLLQRSGHSITWAANGQQGLAALEEHSYDVIMCDLRMPDLDGPGFYRELARRYLHLLSRVIFLTGDVLSPEVHGFFEQVKSMHLTKPFKAPELRRAIQQVLATR
jgi:PAS domain S-box-containing protein